MSTRVAFFDIDGTVFRSSLLIELVEALALKGIFPKEAPEHYKEAYEAWRARSGSYEAYIGKVVETFLAHIRGVPYGTFADIGRGLAALIFRELPALRLKELTSAVAHYVAGVLDREAMVAMVEELCRSAALGVGDRVKTLRGSLRGVITRVLEDGRVAVRADGSASELLCLPESLLPDD